MTWVFVPLMPNADTAATRTPLRAGHGVSLSARRRPVLPSRFRGSARRRAASAERSRGRRPAAPWPGPGHRRRPARDRCWTSPSRAAARARVRSRRRSAASARSSVRSPSRVPVPCPSSMPDVLGRHTGLLRSPGRTAGSAHVPLGAVRPTVRPSELTQLARTSARIVPPVAHRRGPALQDEQSRSLGPDGAAGVRAVGPAVAVVGQARAAWRTRRSSPASPSRTPRRPAPGRSPPTAAPARPGGSADSADEHEVSTVTAGPARSSV